MTRSFSRRPAAALRTHLVCRRNDGPFRRYLRRSAKERRSRRPDLTLGMTPLDVRFETRDGPELEGHTVAQGAAVISSPGRAGSQRPAQMLARHGYGVLLFDRRGEGESEGTRSASAGTATRTFSRLPASYGRAPRLTRTAHQAGRHALPPDQDRSGRGILVRATSRAVLRSQPVQLRRPNVCAWQYKAVGRCPSRVGEHCSCYTRPRRGETSVMISALTWANG